MNKFRLLVVDNYVNLGLLYKQELNDEGYEVDVANSGIKALELIENNSYDLVIIDVVTLGIDSLEMLSRILKTKKGLSVILNTGCSNVKDNSMNWIADAYVVKSSDISELKGTIKKLVIKKSEKFPEKGMFI